MTRIQTGLPGERIDWSSRSGGCPVEVVRVSRLELSPGL
jgi:hypothetical protein